MTNSTSPENDTYDQALHQLLSLADRERVSGAMARLNRTDIRRMVEFTELLGNPQSNAPVIHIAGTKGKGSVAAMVAAILARSGLKTGLYTSPHLHTFNERIRVSGYPIPQGEFAGALNRIWPEILKMGQISSAGSPSTFEALTAMAFDIFRSQHVDVQILESGLGGRLDATNVASASVAGITSISLDHMAILGETISAIATEKAEIIKQGCQVVSAPQTAEAESVIFDKVSNSQARLCLVGRDVHYVISARTFEGQQLTIETQHGEYPVTLSLVGDHQAENAAVAVAIAEMFLAKLKPSSVSQALAEVQWDGRFQVVGRNPTVIVDGAHNPFSMGRLRQAVLDYTGSRQVKLVFGCSGDKQLVEMAAEIAPVTSQVYAVVSRHPRSTNAEEIVGAFRERDIPGLPFADVHEAIDRARMDSGASDVILIAGSLFVAAEALQYTLGIAGEYYPEFDPQAEAVRSKNAGS